MEEILISKDFDECMCVYEARFDDLGYSAGNLYLYSNKGLNEYLLHIQMRCEGQSKRDGDSFFKFESFCELKTFMLNDEDAKKFSSSCYSFEKDFEKNFTEKIV